MSIPPKHDRGEGDERERLGGLLKRCRARIGFERASLGMYLRLPMRVGKAVTQEEVAEAAGISRQWYALLENDRRVRVSATTLGRIADALMMDIAERASLFQLAIPEIRSASLTDGSATVLEAFASFRNLTRSLWAASTEEEALTLVIQYGMAAMAPDVMVLVRRVGDGQWAAERHPPIDADPTNSFFALLRERWGPAALDDVHCYTLMPQPGDLMTLVERDTRFPDQAAALHAAIESVGIPGDLSSALATVRTQHGFVGRLATLYETAHAYSEVERAQLSALADLTSLALSGRA